MLGVLPFSNAVRKLIVKKKIRDLQTIDEIVFVTCSHPRFALYTAPKEEPDNRSSRQFSNTELEFLKR